MGLMREREREMQLVARKLEWVQNRSEFTPEVYLGANIYRWSESRQTKSRKSRIVASLRSSRIPKESKPREKKGEETRGDGKSRINKRPMAGV